jgi:hypothetical protein
MIAGWLQIMHSEIAVNPGSNEIIVAINPGLKMTLLCRSERLVSLFTTANWWLPEVLDEIASFVNR